MVVNLDKVCECFLVPFQSGSDAVLRRMRRGYTYDSYMRIIDRIKRLVPDAAICGDVIVGFPGTLGSNVLLVFKVIVVLVRHAYTACAGRFSCISYVSLYAGETDADFDSTLKLMEDVRFDNLK